MLRMLLLVWVSLVSCFSYCNAYDQQYQVGDTGPNGGTVTNVTVTETNTDTTYETIGDFIEMTDTFVYTETITESVETTTSTTTFVTQETQTENLLTTSVQDAATLQGAYDCSTQSNCYGMGSNVEITTGNQSIGGGSATVTFDLSEYDSMSELDYGGKVYSHSSNAQVPNCNQTSGDCKDDFKVTLRLYNGNNLVETFTHNYTGISWSGVRDYEYNQDVSSYNFDEAQLEFYGIDQGYNTGYYGPGFSDAFLQVTYTALIQQINSIIDYVTMTTIKQTTEYKYESIYSPQPVEEIDTFEPMEANTVELSFDTASNETMTFEFEVVEVDSVVEVNMTTDFGGDLEVETIEVIDVAEVLDMPAPEMAMDMPDIQMEMAELEVEMPEIEVSSPEPEVTVEPEVEVSTPEPDSTQSEPETSTEPEPETSTEPEATEPEPEPEATEPEPEESNEPEQEQEPEEQSEPESRSEQEPEEQESEQEESKEEEKEEKEESKEEKVKTAVAKAKQKVAQRILEKIINSNDTIALDSTKLSLMIALSDQDGFNQYQQMQLQDLDFYLDDGLVDRELPINSLGQYFLFGGADLQMNDLIDLQYR